MISLDKIMVSFDVTFLYRRIPLIDTLNIIKDFVIHDDEITRKTFLDLFNLALTTAKAINLQFYQEADGVAMR